MKKIFLIIALLVSCGVLTSCSETVDCVCTDGIEQYYYYDWAGSCSDVAFDMMKAETGAAPMICEEQ
ncbi:MAG: hypothetical protein J6Q96_01275 [Bacteroidales bacterium]|jgi:hypothetical protein|nr:hypothetical protein [Bacteroidales bacterium]MBQ2375502.1 hypothetical protein [Bacteroidales bacterium]MBQ2397026.1 hypothetical protein [Bacteroidales bacterium]MBQ5872974.1 hypothetical protein [Bacteroidales bacterium]MBQ5891186.1 hypothetical protein [Bacteroidales bacterium]